MILRVVLVVAAVVAALVAAALIFAATRPDTFQIQRSIVISAPPEKVFPLINDLHNWPRWAPQDREDSTMKRTFAGTASGTGATSEWSGSGSSGQGRMLITESEAPRRVSIQVNFVKPFFVENVNQFTLEAVGSATRVTWSMHGPNIYVLKLMSVFMNMDRMMGKHFEDGLGSLKAVAEG